jgi:hypothetical protein
VVKEPFEPDRWNIFANTSLKNGIFKEGLPAIIKAAINKADIPNDI